ncbi:unnamed protein product, partial [Didymodactylos carnosus]
MTLYGIVVDSNDSLYISDGSYHRVVKWEKNSTNGTLIAGVTGEYGDDSTHLDFPHGIYVDFDYDALYVADINNNRIQRFHPIGNLTGETVAGG